MKVGTSPDKKQRLYIMEITIAGKTYCKVGKASGHSAKERMLQIAGSYFDKYRALPVMTIKRDREVPTDKVFEYETCLHRFFKDYQYLPVIAFSGSTELFNVPVEDVVMAYEAVITGEVPDFTYVKEEDILPF